MRVCFGIVGLLMVSFLQAQDVQLFGLGRSVVSMEGLSGNMLEGDTSHADRGTGGYTLLDIGVRLQPYDHFKAHGIVRVKNTFGVFWGEGTTLTLREFRFEGVVLDKVNYSIGDLDLKMTPFTLFVPDMYPQQGVPAIFRMRREIQDYENFTDDHQRRLQGFSAFSAFQSSDKKHELKCRFFTTRYPSTADVESHQLLVGEQAAWTYKEKTMISLNGIHHMPLNPVPESITHHIGTVSYEGKLPFSHTNLWFEGETGISFHKGVPEDGREIQNTGAFSWNELIWNPSEVLTFSAGCRYVGAGYYSPGAQTGRYSYYQHPSIFPYHGADYQQRPQLLYDHLTQENIYNPTIALHLWPYFPRYNNVFPYGKATPNRKGLSLHSKIQDKNEKVRWDMDFFKGGEMKGEGSPQTRRFFRFLTTLSVKAENLLGRKKEWEFNTSIQHQHTARDGNPSLDLRNTLLTAGMEAELLTDFYFQYGVNMHYSKGNESMPLRDIYNRIYDYETGDWDEKEWFVSTGLRYSFSTNSFFTLHMNFTGLKETLARKTFASMTQCYLNFTITY